MSWPARKLGTLSCRTSPLPYNSRVHDIVIVGAGPAGLLAAARCAQAGLDVVIFEEHSRVGEPTHCTGILSLESAELVKIPEEICLNRLTRAALVSPGGYRAEFTWSERKEQIVVVDRGEFDRRLADEALAAGAILKLGARVERVQRDSSSVEVVAGGERAGAKVAILACGVSYALQRQLGLSLPSRVIHTAQAEVVGEPQDRVELYFGRHIAPGGYAWVTPVVRNGDSALKIGMMAEGDAGAYLQSFLACPAIQAKVRAPAPPPVRRVLPLGPAPTTCTSRVLVIGDAAGLTKPTTGGGIFYSLLSATYAAETAIEAHQAGQFDASFLQRYEQRWQKRLGSELRIAQWFRGLLARCGDAEIDRLIRALGSHDVQRVIHSAARFNWHRDVILSMLHQPGVLSLLLRSLVR